MDVVYLDLSKVVVFRNILIDKLTGHGLGKWSVGVYLELSERPGPESCGTRSLEASH